jgi:hypothetical protein
MGMAPGLLDCGSGSRALTSPRLASLPPVLRFADAMLDGHVGKGFGFVGVHVGLLVWNRAVGFDASILR